MGHVQWGIVRQLEEDARRSRRAHLASTRARIARHRHVVRLEEDVAWARLVASTLAALCIEKGLVTEDELKARLASAEAAAAAAPPEPPPAAKPARIRRRPRR